MTRASRRGADPGPGPGRRRALRTATAFTAATVAVAALALTAWGAFLLQPRADEPVRADAVVMLAGADDGRHLHARDLVEAGYADTLLVSNPGGNSEFVARRLCTGIARPADAEVVCFSPEPRTTWGEAQAIAAIAGARGWERVLVVTNRPHTLRAGRWMRAATGLDVRMTPIRKIDRTMLPVHLVWEIAGFVEGRINGHWRGSGGSRPQCGRRGYGRAGGEHRRVQTLVGPGDPAEHGSPVHGSVR